MKFEHRDLHWGNILVSKTDEEQFCYVIGDRCLIVSSEGIDAVIIDYTLSRMEAGIFLIFFNNYAIIFLFIIFIFLFLFIFIIIIFLFLFSFSYFVVFNNINNYYSKMENYFILHSFLKIISRDKAIINLIYID